MAKFLKAAACTVLAGALVIPASASLAQPRGNTGASASAQRPGTSRYKSSTTKRKGTKTTAGSASRARPSRASPSPARTQRHVTFREGRRQAASRRATTAVRQARPAQQVTQAPRRPGVMKRFTNWLGGLFSRRAAEPRRGSLSNASTVSSVLERAPSTPGMARDAAKSLY